MKLKRILMLLVLTMFVSTGAIAANQAVKITINGIPLQADVPAQIVNGSTLVPMRAILEKFEFDVEWNQSTQTVIATKPDLSVRLKINSKVAIVNNREVALDQPAIIIADRTMVPIRFISELLGAKVDWDSARQLALIDGLKINDNSQTIYYGSENLLYKGEVKNNLPHGKGTVYYPDSSIKYIGNFKDGKRDGYIYYYSKDGKLLHQGNFKNDVMVPPVVVPKPVPVVQNRVSVQGNLSSINLLNFFGKSRSETIRLLGKGYTSGSYSESNYVQYNNLATFFLSDRNNVGMMSMNTNLIINGKNINKSMNFSQIQKALGVSAKTGYNEYFDAYIMEYRLGIYRFTVEAPNSGGRGGWTMLTIKNAD